MYHKLCADIPPHDERVSLFLGHCGVMRHLRPAAVNVGIDIDPAALELWRGFRWDSRSPAALAGGGPSRLQLLHGDAFAWLRHRFGLLEWPQPMAALLHPEQVLFQLYGRNFRRPRPAGDDSDGGAAAPPPHAARSANTQPSTLNTQLAPVPFLFVDPPYPRATLSSPHRYAQDLTDEQHAELLTLLQSVPALVMVLSYPNRLYADALRGWRTWTFRATTRGGMRTEQVWCNYPRPLRLHDPRFAGRDRRQREKQARRVRNWTKLFGRMSANDRGAILAALLQAETRLESAESIFAGVCHRCGTTRPGDVVQCPVCQRLAGDVADATECGAASRAASAGGERSPAASERGDGHQTKKSRPVRSRPKAMARRRAK